MRTIKLWLALVAAAVMTLALPFGTVRAGEQKPIDNDQAQMLRFLAKFTPAEVLTGNLKVGHVCHQDIFADPTGHLYVFADVAAREEPWLDGLNRMSNELHHSFNTMENRDEIVVKLKEPKQNKGGDERWCLEDLTPTSKTYALKLEYKGKLYDSLLPPTDWPKGVVYPPEELIRRPAFLKDKPESMTIATMPKEKYFWVSAGSMIMDGEDALFPKKELVFADPFSDRSDEAACLRFSGRGLECYTALDTKRPDSRSMSMLYAKDRQSSDPQVFNRNDYVKVNVFVGPKGAVDAKRPDRLPDSLVGEHIKDVQGKWMPFAGEKVYLSCRFVYMTEIVDSNGNRLLRFSTSQEGLYTRNQRADGRGTYMMLEFVPQKGQDFVANNSFDMSWTWPIRSNPPNPSEIGCHPIDYNAR